MNPTIKPPAGLALQIARSMLAVTLFLLLACLLAAHMYFGAQRKHSRETRAMKEAVENARRLETFFETCRQDLLLAASQPLSKASLAQWLDRLRRIRSVSYVELAWTPAISGLDRMAANVYSGTQGAATVNSVDVKVEGLTSGIIAAMQPGEAHLLGLGRPLATGRTGAGSHGSTPKTVFRLGLFCDNPSLGPGVLSLAVDAREVRNRMRPLPARADGLRGVDENRFSWFADASGWILFQSAPAGRPDRPLETYLARTDLDGTLGKSGHAAAFRPSDALLSYWSLIGKLQADADAKVTPELFDWPGSAACSAFAPVRVKTSGGEAAPVGMVVYADRDVEIVESAVTPFFVSLAAFCALFLILSILFLHRLAVLPLRELSETLDHDIEPDEIEEIMSSGKCLETWRLLRAMRGWRERRAHSAVSLEQSQAAAMREPADIDAQAQGEAIPEIRGFAPKLHALKHAIQKAAGSDVDLLIIGETGTGKQLAAEAVHRLSSRADKPFISINCGALDDNLLLDALFGHVPGAFTQAKTHRKGAFVEADGGALFLDEIQNASPKTQQALLRVLTERRIRPLGSDEEIKVDVRILAGSNKELAQLVPGGEFREDLYYRLNVFSLRTMPLREQKESIPLLAAYYLRQAEELADANGLRLSRGALEKLLAYDWPGNVRELINCVTRAAVMAANSVIQAEEIKLDEETPAYLLIRTEEAQGIPLDPPAQARDLDNGEPLSARQRLAMKEIRRRRVISRKDYQEIVGGFLPARAALDDLNDLARRGFITRRGRGPATRYEIGSAC
jgi:two-component system, NtrC family, response regulator HydG